MSRRVPPTINVITSSESESDLTTASSSTATSGLDGSSNGRRAPPSLSKTSVQKDDDIPELIPTQLENTLSSINPSEKISELLSNPDALNTVMSGMQSNPQAASMVRTMINDPTARREVTRMIEQSGADIELMKSLNPKANKHRGDRPKRKEIMKLQKQAKSMMKTANEGTLIKMVKITVSRQLKEIEIASPSYPDGCLAKITTSPGHILGMKEFTYKHPKDGTEQYLTLLYVEDDKSGQNKLVKRKFGAEYGREVLIIGGTVDNPSSMSIGNLNEIQELKVIGD